MKTREEQKQRRKDKLSKKLKDKVRIKGKKKTYPLNDNTTTKIIEWSDF